MKKSLLILFGLAGLSLTSQAQLENYSISLPPPCGPVLVAGGMPVATPVVYDQPVVYTAPVQYFAPVQYNAPVYYSTGPVAPVQAYCPPAYCSAYNYSTVQVIPFGGGQARRQGYAFGRRR